MLFANLKRRCGMTRYLVEVQNFLDENSFNIVQKLYSREIGDGKLKEKDVVEILGEDYPKAPWIDADDYIAQFSCFIQTIGYTYCSNHNNSIVIEPEGLSRTIINNYLDVNSNKIVERLALACLETGGKISYANMIQILGFKPCTVERSNQENMRFCVLLFLTEIYLPFKSDDTHIYFP